MSNATIVCIDDESTILNSLRDQLLRNFGDQVAVEIAENGDEALGLLDELAQEGIHVPLVICDQIMPEMSGDQVLCEIQRRHPRTLKILLTGLSSFDSVVKAVNHANLYRYLPKPWNETDLNLAVRGALRSYFQEEKLAAQNLQLQIANKKLEQEIHERKQAELQLIQLASHDALTGLPNRKFFMECLESSLQEIQNDSTLKFAVMFIDLDRFKVINDSLGHDVGDRVLIEISRWLKRCVRSTDFVARLGGDEFTVLIKPIATIYDAMEIADRVLTTLSAPFELNGKPFSIGASIGILEGSGAYENSIDLLRDADTAMYNAKSNGKARYSVFNSGMHDKNLQLWRIESALQNALEHGELYLEYQPIFSLETGRLRGLEALVQWKNSERGLISPDDFMPVAEESGLILMIGEWVLQEACHQMKLWHDRFPELADLTLSVNISSKQIQEVQCVEILDRILAETGLEGRLLTLELRERELISDLETTIYTMQQLRDRGLHLSIDGFGRGYSSLSGLYRMPIGSLKVDRLFSQQISAHPESCNLVRGIVSLAHSLNLAVVVDGIETLAQMQFMKAVDCEFGQGSFFSPPLATQAMENYLLEQLVTH
jgi:diguanylate cyclase (GGDEF)-like protein